MPPREGFFLDYAGDLRIAIVYDCLYPHTFGGAERWLRALAEALSEEHEVRTSRAVGGGGARDPAIDERNAVVGVQFAGGPRPR